MELVYLSYSPWSERARWALEHHRVEYLQQPYTPMIGEPGLRLRLKRFSGKVTVPVLFTDEGPLADSTDIARYADRIGRGSPLIPKQREADILSWISRADRAMDAGRNLVTRRMSRSAGARLESLPRGLRKAGMLGDALALSGVGFFMRKYGLRRRSEDDDTKELAVSLEALRVALVGRTTVLGEFSYADIVAAGLLQVVTPVAGRFVHLGPATRAVWSTPELAARYADLIEWRDRLYAEYRQPG